MITVAIIGSASHVARALMPLLDADDRIGRVIGIDVRAPSRPVSKLEFHRCDVRDDPVAIAALLRGADIVVHLAFIVLRKYGMAASDIEAINVQGTRNVCEAAALAGARKLIFASSIMAYGAHPDAPIPIPEDYPTRGNPEVYYSRHKVEIERFLDRFEEQHPDILVTRLRPATITSSEPEGTNAGQLAPVMVLIKGKTPLVQFVHDTDVAMAFHLAIVEDLPGVYNVTPDEPQSMAQLAADAGQRTLVLPEWLVMPLAYLAWRTGVSGLAPELVATLSSAPIVASNAKLKSCGWTPRYSTTEAYKALRAGSRRRGRA